MLVRPLVRSVVSPLVRGVTQRGRRFIDPTALAAAVAAMSPKAWYDRSGGGPLYLDTAGTTLASAAGNTVALGLSKDLALGLGSEIVTDPNMGDASKWFFQGSWSIAGGKLIASAAPAGRGAFPSNILTAVAGRTYLITLTITSLTAGGCRIVAGASLSATFSAPGTYTVRLTAADASNIYVQTQGTSTSLEASLLSCKILLGNHQVQATAAARPAYQVNPKRLVFDGVDDVLNTTFPAALGTSCTVGRAVPGTGAVITAGVNIGTSFADNVTAGALVIIDRALTVNETTALAAYLNYMAA